MTEQQFNRAQKILSDIAAIDRQLAVLDKVDRVVFDSYNTGRSQINAQCSIDIMFKNGNKEVIEGCEMFESFREQYVKALSHKRAALQKELELL